MAGDDAAAASPGPAVRAEISRWARLELAAWRGLAVTGQPLWAELKQEAERESSVFLFHIAGGRVSVDDKSIGYADPPPGDYGAAMLFRAGEYRRFLEEVLGRFTVPGSGVIAFDLEDLGRRRFPVPVFAFQKRRGANTVLLPDVDFLHRRFFEADREPDRAGFDEKLDEAIFVGSTTGNPCLTSADVHAGRNARLRAAAFFRDRPGIRFELPNIVQIDTPETFALIAGLDVGGPGRDWAEQAARKYLISMDGNGATCSRVVLSLLGNNVLLKYNSPHLLYYFHGLTPWLHYVPIVADGDIVDLLAEAARNRPLHRDIAARSRSFALDYLSRDAVMFYAAELIRTYLAWFGEH